MTDNNKYKYLIRTMHDRDVEHKVGDTVRPISAERLRDMREKYSTDVSCDSALVANTMGNLYYNHKPDTAFSAVGISDKDYSLYPLVSLRDLSNDRHVKDGILLNDDYIVPVESLPYKFMLYAQKHGMNALKRMLLQKLYSTAYDNFGIDKRNYDDKDALFDDLYDVGLTKVLASMHGDVTDKRKYARLLDGLRWYADDKDKDYDTPQISLIQVNPRHILTSFDKLYDDSAEQDGPEEYRVHGYKVKGIWTPRQVDDVIKKYYKDYDPRMYRRFASIKDADNEKRAYDTVSEVINLPADKVQSDANVKNIYSCLDDCYDKYMQHSSICDACKELGQ